MNGKTIVNAVLGFVLVCMAFGMAPEGRAYGAASVGDPEIVDVFELMYDGGENHIHGSTIAELPDGELLVAWFQGNGEKDGDSSKIMGSRLPAGESKWTAPFVMADTPGFPDINPAMYVDGNGRLWLFWYPILANRFETSQPKYVYAEAGHYEFANGYAEAPAWDWQEIMYVNPADDFTQKSAWDGSGFVHRVKGSEMRYFDDASLLDRLDPREYVPVQGRNSGQTRYMIDSFVVGMRNVAEDTIEDIRRNGAFGDRTQEYVDRMMNQELPQAIARATGADNNLREWNPIYTVIGWQTKNKAMEIEHNGTKRLLLPLYSDSLRISVMAYSDDRGLSWNYSGPIAGVGNIQAATVRKEDGTLRSYFRNIAPGGEIVYSESADGGETWGVTQVDSHLKHNAGFDIVKLQTGEWLLAHTDSVGSRNSLSLSISDDEGKTWTTRPIQRTDDTGDKIHYPAIIQAKDGTVYVSYSQAIRAGDMKNIRIAKFTDFVVKEPNKIVSIRQANVTTHAGEPPALPSVVTAVYEDATEAPVDVLWDPVDPQQYAAPGAFDVYGTAEGTDIRAVARVTVVDPNQPAVIVSIEEEEVMTEAGKAPVLPSVVTAVYSDNTTAELDVVWDSIDPSLYAVPGKFDVTGEVAESELKAVARVTVVPVAVTGIVLDRDRLSLYANDRAVLKATVMPQEATNQTVHWKSDRPHVATVDQQGTVAAVGTGTAIVTATTDDGRFEARAMIEVRSASGGGGGGSVIVSPEPTPKVEPKPEPEIGPGTETEPEPEREPGTKPQPRPVVKFADIAAYPWAEEAIESLASLGIVKGTSSATFEPGKNVTRADFLTILIRAYGLSAPFQSNFADAAPDDYFYEALGTAKALGIANGADGEHFRPREPISRQDAMVLIVRVMKHAGNIDIPDEGADMSRFRDAASVSAYAAESVNALVKLGIVQGRGDRIDPFGQATRAEAAVMIFRLLEFVGS